MSSSIVVAVPASRPTAAPHTGAAESHMPDLAAPFDRQLDAARQQHAAQNDASGPSEPAPSPTPSGEAKADASPSSPDTAGDDDMTAASALAGAMLAWLGPAPGAALRPAAGAAVTAASRSGSEASGDAELAEAVLAGTGKSAGEAATAALLAAANAATAGTSSGNAAAMPAALATALAGPDGGKDGSALAVPTMNLPSPVTAASAPMHLLQLQPPTDGHGFAEQLGQQVAWLSGQDLKQARIRLHPQELGQLDVKVTVTHSHVDVVFSAQHVAAVTTVQQSLPQLGQMLAQQGLTLGHAEVGQHGHGGSSDGAHGGAAGETGADDGGDLSVAITPLSGSVIGLLDAFA